MSMNRAGRHLLRYCVAFAFIAAGIAHLLHPAAFAMIVPPGLGNPMLDVVLSGCAEIAGGVGILLAWSRRAAGIGLALLLLAVWPANWYMAIHADRFVHLVPAWVLWLRLPLQLVFFALVRQVVK